MSSFVNLQFDTMVVDTKLAEEYIKRNNSEFHCIDAMESSKCKYDGAKNKIHCMLYFNQESAMQYSKRHLIQLADNIEENMDCFCQLEYLIRQKPIQTTTLELKMIIKHLRCQASLDTNNICGSSSILMKNDSPLIKLGWIGQMNGSVNIVAAEDTAVVCYLFTNLCRTSGLNAVNLGFVSNMDITSDKFSDFTENEALKEGCIGVVTTQSDVDSAVDVFLSAPKGDLWGIRRILVQESAIERFNSEFTWKTQSGTQANDDSQLKSLCTDLYVYDNKIFLRDYVGNDANLRDVVLIESFRTIKELLTLIESYSPFCVSLWSHGVAESNEIAFGITAPMVWVNCYGVLGNPNWTCLGYFSQISICENNPELNKLRKLQKDWQKLTHNERRKKMLAGLKDMMTNDKFHSYVLCVRTAEGNIKNLVDVGASDLLIADRKPRGVYTIKLENLVNATDIIQCLLDGGGFAISIPQTVEDAFEKFLSRLAEIGLPIHFTETMLPFDTFPLDYTTRIVHTGFGTIFAN